MTLLRSTILFLAALAGSAASASEPAWEALRAGGSVVLIRHARVSGTGDPPGFRLDACSTQRNLSERGRDEARALGRRFAAERVVVAELRSSRWCRAQDTARLAFPETAVTSDPTLDSFFDAAADGPRQTAELRQLVLQWRNRPGAMVLVTHQVNVTALAGVAPAEGEIVVVRPEGDRILVVGRAAP